MNLEAQNAAINELYPPPPVDVNARRKELLLKKRELLLQKKAMLESPTPSTIDTTPVKQKPAPETTLSATMGDIPRQLARTGKDILAGTAGTMMDLSQTLTAPIFYGASKAASALGNEDFAQSLQAPLKQSATQEFIRNPIDQLTGGVTKPRNAIERGVDAASEFLASSITPAGLEKAGVTAMDKLVPKTTTDMVSQGLAAAGAGIGRAMDSPLMEAGLSVLGGGVPGLVKGGMKTLLPNAENMPNQKTMQAAQDLGVPLPPSVKNNSRIMKFLESRTAQSGLSGDSFDNLTKEIDDGTIKAFDDVLDSVSPTKTLSPQQVGQDMQKALAGRQKAGQRGMRMQYEPMLQKYGTQEADTQATLDYINKVMPKLSKTLQSSPSKDKVLQVFGDMAEKLKSGKTDVETLVNTKIDLGDIADFETVGGVKKYLTGLRGAVNKDIETAGKVNPDFGQSYTQANENARSTITNLRNDLITSVVQAKKPELVLAKLQQPSDITKLELAAGNSQKMQRVVQSLKRAKLEELLVDNVITNATENRESIKFGTMANKLSPRDKNAEMIRRLAGESNYKKLEQLHTYASAMAGSKNFYNMSKSGNVVQDTALMTSAISGIITGVVSLNPGLVIGSTAALSTPYATAKIITNDNIMNLLNKAGQELARGPKARQDVVKNVGLALVKALSDEGITEQKQ